MPDLGNEITNSLSRDGQGGMLAPLPFVDGAVNAPAITFNLEPTLGFYRLASGIMVMAAFGDDQVAFDGNRGVASSIGQPTAPPDLTRKDYVDGLAEFATVASDLTGVDGMLWPDLPPGLVSFSVSAANVQMGDAANILLRIGDTNTPEITGYSSLPSNLADGILPVVNNPNTSGIVIAAVNLAANDIVHGVYEGFRVGNSNNWVITASFINLTGLIQSTNIGLFTLGGDILSIQIIESSGLFVSGTTGLTYQRSV